MFIFAAQCMMNTQEILLMTEGKLFIDYYFKARSKFKKLQDSIPPRGASKVT